MIILLYRNFTCRMSIKYSMKEMRIIYNENDRLKTGTLLYIQNVI